MHNKFRNDLLNKNLNFKNVFYKLIDNGEIHEFPNKLWELIVRDKTSIKIDSEPYSLKDLFHLNLNEGRCMTCVFEMVLLFDKLGFYSEAVKCVNEALIGTAGSSYGGHWYVKVKFFDEFFCIDTSLVVIGSMDSFDKLGHIVIKSYDIDTLFKEYPRLIDYYEEMIIK